MLVCVNVDIDSFCTGLNGDLEKKTMCTKIINLTQVYKHRHVVQKKHATILYNVYASWRIFRETSVTTFIEDG